MQRPALGTLLPSFVLTLGAAPTTAREVRSVELPDEVPGTGPATSMRLNGAEVRHTLFVPVYAIGPYLPAPTSDPARVLAVHGPRLSHMHFLHGEVTHDELVAACEEGFAANDDATALAALLDG